MEQIDADLAAIDELKALPEAELAAVLAQPGDARTQAWERVRRLNARMVRAEEERARQEAEAAERERAERRAQAERSRMAGDALRVIEGAVGVLALMDENAAVGAAGIAKVAGMDAKAAELLAALGRPDCTIAVPDYAAAVACWQAGGPSNLAAARREVRDRIASDLLDARAA